MHDGAALDHGWLRSCAKFEQLQQSAYNERLAEVYMRDALAVHPWRTWSTEDAALIYVPIWEVVSWAVGECNGTTHAQRMSAAAQALRSSPFFGKRRTRKHQPAGFNHVFVSSGCIEDGKRLEQRLTRSLSSLLRASIVGRDRAYSSFYQSSAIGRCTLEVPYVSNPYASVAHARAVRRNATAALRRNGTRAAGSGSQASESAAAGRLLGSGTGSDVVGNQGSAGQGGGHSSGHGGRRRWLLSFMGSLDVCCEPGKSIRAAMRPLTELPPDANVSVVHVGRESGKPLPGRTPAEQLERYQTAGELMMHSRFCLIPAGDNEVSSRLYSAISAGCIPVVVANQLSGAFASMVPYSRFWVRIEQATFVNAPLALLPKLRAISSAEIYERRARMQRHVADVTYEQAVSAHRRGEAVRSPTRGSRLATNFLRAAETGCLRGAATPVTGVYPLSHKYSKDDKWGLNCSCTEAPPRFFWGPTHASSAAARAKLWTRGRVPTEVCRCLHCATLCPVA